MSELVIKDLHAGYVEGVEVLKGINLEVRDGEVLGVIGLNGSGKSTLGKATVNILPYRSGKIFLDGRDITIFATQDLSRLGVSIMRQGGQVFTTMTVQENLDVAFGNNSDQTYRETITKLIPLLQCKEKELMNRTADKLSGGQRHQLALAMALATKPSLLILDEPSAGLSPVSVEMMYSLLEELKRSMNMTIILIEQNINKAISYCNRCILLSQGTIGKVFENSSEEMRKDIMASLGL